MTTDQILAICVAINDCDAIREWERNFHSKFQAMHPDEAYHVHNEHWGMYRVALLFSAMSLRKVADFAENRPGGPDDLMLSDFGLDLKTLTGETQLIDMATRKKINKSVTHLTRKLDPDVKGMDDLRAILRSKEDVLDILGNKFFGMI